MPITSDPLGLHPYYIPQSAGDLEEARIKRLTDLANLDNLRDQPKQERMRLALQQAGLDEQTAYHASQAASETRGQDITLRGQDVGYAGQARGQDLTAQADAARNATDRRGQDFGATAAKNSNFANIVSSFVAAGGSHEDLATAAAYAGHPELLRAVNDHKQGETAKKAALTLGVYSAVKDKPGFLAQLKESDPEVHAAVMKHLTTLAASQAADAGPTEPLATRLGRGLRNANVRANAATDAIFHPAQSDTFSNFVDGLLNRKKKQ